MAVQTSNLESGRGNNFDALRFVLAAAVIYSHSHLITGAGPDPLERITRGQIYLGAVAVDAFFILSGYLVTASWVRSENLGKFLASRILRIHPGFIVAALVSVVLIGPLGARSGLAYFRELDLRALGWSFLRLKKLTVPATFEWVPGSAGEVNGSLWTVCIEFECYLAVAALGLAGLLRRRGLVVALWGACFAVFWATKIPQLQVGPSTLFRSVGFVEHLRFLLLFLSGAVAWLYRARWPHAAGLAVLAIVALAVTARLGGIEIVLPIALTYLLLHAGFSRRVRVHSFAARGDLSYGIYLYGWPMQLVASLALGRGATLLPHAALALGGAIACAAASWKLVEAPMLRLKPARGPARSRLALTSERQTPSAAPIPS